MTLLTTLRHAKSSWDDGTLNDFDRPLNGRGRKAARRMGRELKRLHVGFDHVIASPALRVRETLGELEKGYGKALDIRFEPQVYGASLDQLVELVRRIPGQVHAPLLVGHNPGLQQLVLKLTTDDDKGFRREAAAKYPTAAVAMIELPVSHWGAVDAESGRIVELILPRELDD